MAIGVFWWLRGWFKGADTRAALHFLERKYNDILQDGLDGDLQNAKGFLTNIWRAVCNANQFLGKLYRAPLFLSQQLSAEISKHGHKLVARYLAVATEAHSMNLCRYKLAPKLHIFWHFLWQLDQDRPFTLNPLSYSCQMDEDLVGRTSALSRKVDVRSVHIQTIRRILVSLRQHI